MTKPNLLQEPIVRHQIGEAGKCVVLLEETARTIERETTNPLVLRAAAGIATEVARELLVTAGMLELVEVLS